MPVFKDITGKRFGRLVVINRAESDRNNNTKWVCECDCGAITITLASSLKSGHSKSCGCLAKEVASELWSTHRMSRTPEYTSWQKAKDRCYSHKNDRYPRYGGRGIKMCPPWRRNFSAFLSDMGSRPLNTTLGRIDNDKGYSKGNCRWETNTQQNRNKGVRRDSVSGITGVSRTPDGCRWRVRITANRQDIHLGTYDTIPEAKAARLAGEERYWNDDD